MSQGELCRMRSNQSTARTSFPRASMESFSKICGGQYGARPRVRQRKMTALQGNWSSNSFMTEVYPPEEKKG